MPIKCAFAPLAFAKRKLRGFTLIELLVVIAVVGLLAAVVLVSVGNVRNQTRDNRRMAELITLAKVLDFYHSENNQYPERLESVSLEDDEEFANEMASYISRMPQDTLWPSEKEPGVPFSYKYKSTAGGSEYKICAELEEKDEPYCVYSSYGGSIVMEGGGESGPNLEINGADTNDFTFQMPDTALPGETGGVTWIVVNSGDADGYLDLVNVIITNDGGAFPEPEWDVDPDNSGDVGDFLSIELFVDSNNNTIIDGGETVIFSGLVNNIATGYDLNLPLIASGGTDYLQLNWNFSIWAGNECAGDILILDMDGDLS